MRVVPTTPRLSVTLLSFVAGVAVLFAGSAPAVAAPPNVLQVEFQPAADDLQIAVWLEDSTGNFVDSLFITRAVGTFGIGNRPGNFDLKSGFRWPYGRRTNALPIWAYKQGRTWPLVVFEDGRETSVAYHEEDSSAEGYFCRPTQPGSMFCYKVVAGQPCKNVAYPSTSSHGPAPAPIQDLTVDAITCPSVATLSKGRYAVDGRTTVYPPRNDLTTFTHYDDPSTKTFAADNPLDAISRATPVSALPYKIYYMLKSVPDGDYVVWVEANREFDQNASNMHTDPPDSELEWNDYGAEQIGQPSVVYKVPVHIHNGQIASAQVADYGGYGQWDGRDGTVFDPDDSITTDTPGSGAGRLALNPSGGYRVRVSQASVIPPPPPMDGGVADGGAGGSDAGARDGGMVGHDMAPPAPSLDCSRVIQLTDFVVSQADPGTVTLQVATPNVQDIAQLAEFDLRYSVGVPIANSDDAFNRAVPGPQVNVGNPGEVLMVTVGGLKPQTHYYFAIRMHNFLCDQYSSILLTDMQTPSTPFTTLQGCFVATAAYGSLMSPAIDRLRAVRDGVLMPTAAGRHFVAAYYVVSPVLAGYIASDPELRRVARGLLVPFVQTAGIFGQR